MKKNHYNIPIKKSKLSPQQRLWNRIFSKLQTQTPTRHTLSASEFSKIHFHWKKLTFPKVKIQFGQTSTSRHSLSATGCIRARLHVTPNACTRANITIYPRINVNIYLYGVCVKKCALCSFLAFPSIELCGYVRVPRHGNEVRFRSSEGVCLCISYIFWIMDFKFILCVYIILFWNWKMFGVRFKFKKL